MYECKSGQWVLKGNYANCIPVNTETSTTGQYCPEPGDVENGYKIRSSIRKAGLNQYYGEFEISCFNQYNLIGDPVVKCTSGSWTTYPKCVQKPSCPLNIINEPAINVNILSSNLIYNHDNTGRFKNNKFCFLNDL